MKANSDFNGMREMFWRSEVQSCTTPEQAIKTLEEGGLDTGRAIRFMAKHNPALFNQWSKRVPKQSTSGKSSMQHFRVIGG